MTSEGWLVPVQFVGELFGGAFAQVSLEECQENACELGEDTRYLQEATFHVPTNDTGPRLNIITFASVSKMWRTGAGKRRRPRGTRKADSSVIMIHPARTALRLFICILISVVMLIMRHCFLSRDVFVFHRLPRMPGEKSLRNLTTRLNSLCDLTNLPDPSENNFIFTPVYFRHYKNCPQKHRIIKKCAAAVISDVVTCIHVEEITTSLYYSIN